MLSSDFAVRDTCVLMGVSRAGYYKWKNREPSAKSLTRAAIVEKVRLIHESHPTHGYRWTAAYLWHNMGIRVSDNFVYKCYRYLGIKSETTHRVRTVQRKSRDHYPNLIFSTWDTVDRPRQVIVSDMTALSFGGHYYEVTFYFDVFTKEVLSYRLAGRRGDREQYLDGLSDVVDILKGATEPTILHTDRGSVYASLAYNELIKDTMIVRSMSRAGKPTDNPVNEALNGWIKEELLMDFRITGCHSREEVENTLKRYVYYYNEKRPCYAIGYDTPLNFRRRFMAGELPKKDTFAQRELSEIPKFIKLRRKNSEKERVTT